MATIKDLEKYIDYEFSSGCYTGDDYKSFQTKYINFLRSICKQNHWQLVNVGRNHYCFSAFIKSAENKCVYVSISDVKPISFLSRVSYPSERRLVKDYLIFFYNAVIINFCFARSFYRHRLFAWIDNYFPTFFLRRPFKNQRITN